MEHAGIYIRDLARREQVVRLWAANSHRQWPRTLLRMYDRGDANYHTMCIDYWRKQFAGGADETIHCMRRTLQVQDGNHRLVAAHLENKQFLSVEYV